MIASPQERQTKNRRSEQSKWRSHRKWKDLVEEKAHIPTAVCVLCGKHHNEVNYNKKGDKKVTYLTINHITRALYYSEEAYSTWDEHEMEICCTTCNWRIEHGEKPCPICKHVYINWRELMCQGCWDKAHPEEAERRAEAKWKKTVLWGLKKVLNKEAQAVARKQIREKLKR